MTRTEGDSEPVKVVNCVNVVDEEKSYNGLVRRLPNTQRSA